MYLISRANIPISDWDTSSSLREHFRSLGDKFVGAEIPNKSGCYLNVQLPEEDEWAYFVSMIDNLLGEDNWIAVMSNGYGVTPWLSAAKSPNKNQRIRLFYTNEQQLRDQLQKLEKKYNPEPFVWDCPEAEQEQEAEDDIDAEETEDDFTESSPLVQSFKKEKVSAPKCWSQLPWQELEEAFKEPVEGNPVRKKKRKKIPFILSLADAYHLGMGGTLVPLQQMLIWGTTSPLSQTGMQLKPAEMKIIDPKIEERKRRTERFNKAKAVLLSWLNSDQYKNTRKIKQQIREGIPYFPPPLTLELTPLESINTPEFKTFTLYSSPWTDPDIRSDKMYLESSREWEESYHWDYVARKVALSWHRIKTRAGHDPRKFLELWGRAMREDPHANILDDQHYDDVVDYMDRLHRAEWDLFINSRRPGKRDFPSEYRLALQVCYNEAISEEERERRFGTLVKAQSIGRSMIAMPG
jgi:hypothetical protein